MVVLVKDVPIFILDHVSNGFNWWLNLPWYMGIIVVIILILSMCTILLLLFGFLMFITEDRF